MIIKWLNNLLGSWLDIQHNVDHQEIRNNIGFGLSMSPSPSIYQLKHVYAHWRSNIPVAF